MNVNQSENLQLLVGIASDHRKKQNKKQYQKKSRVSSFCFWGKIKSEVYIFGYFYVKRRRMQQFENNENDGYEYDPKQRAPPAAKHQIRPRVDPEAEGEVDPTL